MKKLFTTLFLLALTINLVSQMQVGGQPYELSVEQPLILPELSEVRLPALDMKKVNAEDVQNAKEGRLELFSRYHYVGLNLHNSGSWFTMPNGDKMWRLKISAKNAMAIHLVYDQFFLPEGSIMYIYNEDYTDIIGGYTSNNNKKSGVFATGNVVGETSIIEYYQPADVVGKAIININKVGHAYRWIAKASVEEKADPCEVDVACSPESDSWQNQIKGVVRLLIQEGGGAGWCSGSLINNTSLDCAPYVLTALHCGLSSSTSDLNASIAYFNYQRPSCGSGSPSSANSMTGMTRRADSDDGGGSSGPDYLLMEMNNSIPVAYNVFYNGWSNSNGSASSGVSIHHPSGDEKKISTFTSSLGASGWGISGTHWRVFWVATPNGHGVTEGGSSGSPIFNQNGQIVGQLTGGGSFCSDIPFPNADFYGRMNINWNTGPKNPGDALKDWLDPISSGVTTLDGTFVPCAAATYDNSAVNTIDAPNGNYCSLDVTPSIVIKNNGLDNVTSAEIEYDVDGGATLTHNWTGTLFSGNTVTVNLPTITTSAGSHTFNVDIVSTNGGTDGDASDNTGSSSFTTAAPLTSSLAITDPACGATDGAVSSTIVGGTAGYTYLWSTSSTSTGITGLGIGTYFLTVTDVNGCTVEDTATLVNVGAPVVSASVTSESCNGLCDGTLDASSTGGTGAISYDWTGGVGSGASHTGVCPSTYTVTATDALGCESESTVTVGSGANYPTADFMNIPSTTTAAVGTSITFINTSSGGASSYLWDFGDGSTSSATNPGGYAWGAAGDYTVTLYASNGPCSDSISVLFTITPNSISEWFNEMEVLVYPNPTEGSVQLELEGSIELNLLLDVHGVDGKLYHTQNVAAAERKIEVDLSDYASGIYFLTLRAEGHRLVRRVAKF